MNDSTSLRTLAALGLATALSLTLVAPRQDTRRAVRATGVGRAALTPTHLELRAIVVGEAELAADARSAYEEARRRAIATFEGLGVDGLTVVPLGHQISYGPPVEQDANMTTIYPGVPDPLEGTRFWEVLLVEVAGIDGSDEAARAELGATLLDAAVDEGLSLMGGQPIPRGYQPRAPFDYSAEYPLRWRSPDRTALETRARAAALADARRQALEVAAASGDTLGPMIDVTLQPAKVVHTYRRPFNHFGSAPQGALQEEMPYGGALQVEASVRFALD